MLHCNKAGAGIRAEPVKRIRSTLRGSLPGLWALLAAVLVMRALVPSGWMPDFTGADGFSIRICGPANIAPKATHGNVSAPKAMAAHAMHSDAAPDSSHGNHQPPEDNGAHADHDADPAHSSVPCMFAGFGNATPPPEAPTLVALALPLAPLRSVEPARILLSRARYIQPPGRAPPVRA